MPSALQRAKAAGDKTYFTGTPCKRGHVADRWVATRTCVLCQRVAYRECDRRRAEERKEYDKNRYEKNRESILAANKKWHRENREQKREYIRNWRAANPERLRAQLGNRYAIRRAAEGNYTHLDVARLITKQDGLCAICGVAFGNKYHVDHIMPLTLGGSNWPENLQITCPPCNISKGNKHPDEFLAARNAAESTLVARAWKAQGATPERLINA